MMFLDVVTKSPCATAYDLILEQPPITRPTTKLAALLIRYVCLNILRLRTTPRDWLNKFLMSNTH